MLGCYDFCAHYEWTFEWFRQLGGEGLVHDYWKEAICDDSQLHASKLIQAKGFQGMREYWDHTLVEEGAGFEATEGKGVFRFDMHDCPSKGFLLRNNLEQYHDYCDHCMGWIKPMMDKAGFRIDHEHNHLGLCWWEFRRADDSTAPGKPCELAGDHDVRKLAKWKQGKVQRFGTGSGVES